MKRALTFIFAALAASVPVINYAFIANLPAPKITVVPAEDNHPKPVIIGGEEDFPPSRDVPALKADIVQMGNRRIIVGYKVSRQKAEAKYVDAKDFKDKVIVVEEPTPTPPPLPPVPRIPLIPFLSE